MREALEIRPTNVRYLALILLAISSASAYLTRYCISVSATVVERDLSITHKEMSWVFAAFMVGYLVGQIPGGWLGKRMGTRSALPLVIALWSAFTAWSACSRSLAPLIVSQFAVGVAQAGLVPISSIAVKDWFPTSRRGVPSAVIAASMSAGGVVAMWLTGRLVESWDHDWKRVFLVYAVYGVGWSVVFYLLFRSRPNEHPWINSAELALIAEIDPVRPAADHPQPPATRPSGRSPDGANPAAAGNLALRMATNASVWALGCQWFFRSAGYQFFVRWFPAFLQDRFGMDVDAAGYYSSWPLFGVAIGSLAGGFIVDASLRKTGDKRISRNATSVASLLLCAACLAASESSSSGERFVALMALGAFFSGISMPTGWAATIDIGGEQTPLMFAVMNMAATAAGIVAPTLVGYLMAGIQETGGSYAVVVYLHVAIYILAAAAWLLVNPCRSIDERDLAVDLH